MYIILIQIILRQHLKVKKISPSNYYGKTKSIIEKYLKNKFEICYILRLFNIAGYINKKEFFEFKNKFRRIMPVITEASRKKLLFKINLVKSKRKVNLSRKRLCSYKRLFKYYF